MYLLKPEHESTQDSGCRMFFFVFESKNTNLCLFYDSLLPILKMLNSKVERKDIITTTDLECSVEIRSKAPSMFHKMCFTSLASK